MVILILRTSLGRCTYPSLLPELTIFYVYAHHQAYISILSAKRTKYNQSASQNRGNALPPFVSTVVGSNIAFFLLSRICHKKSVINPCSEQCQRTRPLNGTSEKQKIQRRTRLPQPLPRFRMASTQDSTLPLPLSIESVKGTMFRII